MKTEPSVWLAVFVICAVEFFYINSGSTGQSERLRRAVKGGCYDREAIRRGEIWRLLTVGFTHIAPWHIAMNLYALYNMSSLEQFFGHAWFAVILFGSVAGGSLLEYRMSDTRYYVGLSGGLYGLMFSYFLLMIHFNTLDIRSMVITLVLNAAINFMPGIAWQAHIGGGIAGLLLTELFLLTQGYI